jgi:membrane-associated phospholipid phosphatase
VTDKVESARPAAAPEPVDGRQRAETLNRFALIAVLAYLAIVMTLTVAAGFWPTIDLVAIAVGGLALILGRGRLFFRDWVPFILIFLAWEAMRGLADNFGAAVHSDDIIALERAISFGIVPTVELQRLFHRADAINPLDVVTSLLYAAHFIFPLAVAFVFWLRDRTVYYRFAATLLLMALAGFVVYLLFPVAPPRFAHLHGEALAVRDVMGDTIVNAGMHPSADWVYQNLSPNDNAAMPSLHAAFPVLAWLFLRHRHVVAARFVAVYTLAVWFAIVYLGHHYIVDVLGGVVFAVGAYVVVARLGVLDRALAWLVRTARPSPATPGR